MKTHEPLTERGDAPMIDSVNEDVEGRTGTRSPKGTESKDGQPSDHGSQRSVMEEVGHDHDEEGCNHGKCEYGRKNFKRICEVLEDHETGLVRIEQSHAIFEDVMGTKIDEALDRNRVIIEQMRLEMERMTWDMDTETTRKRDTERLRDELNRVRDEIARVKDTMGERKEAPRNREGVFDMVPPLKTKDMEKIGGDGRQRTKRERNYEDHDEDESSGDDKENGGDVWSVVNRRKINEDKALKEMKGSLTRDNYFIWRSQVLTHMEASHEEMSIHLRKVENAPIADVRNGKYRIQGSKDAQLWSLFYNVWLSKDSGLNKHVRRREGLMTWKLIYDEVTGEQGDAALKYRRWL